MEERVGLTPSWSHIPLVPKPHGRDRVLLSSVCLEARRTVWEPVLSGERMTGLSVAVRAHGLGPFSGQNAHGRRPQACRESWDPSFAG